MNTPLYQYLGLTVGSIKQGMTPEERRKAYAQDIVYVSNKEIVFDYLKDRLATGGMLQSRLRLRRLYSGGRTPPILLRGLHVAIVDEADSVLVDEGSDTAHHLRNRKRRRRRRAVPYGPGACETPEA